MSFAQKLKALREELNMTQKELAKRINVARTTITGYETKNRQPSHEKLTELANILGVSVDYLIADKEDSKTPSMFLTLQNEKAIDQRVKAVYSKLSPKSKEETLIFLQRLEFWEREHPDQPDN